MISHFCVWRMCKRGAWIFPTICTKIQARNLKLKIFSNSAIVGGVEGGARIITQGGGKGTWMPIHTLCHVTHVVPYSQRDSHPYATHAITYSAPWALPCACSTSHITLNRVALQSSWHGPNEFKWSPPLSPTLSYSPSAGEVLILLSLVWSKSLFDNCLMRL